MVGHATIVLVWAILGPEMGSLAMAVHGGLMAVGGLICLGMAVGGAMERRAP